MHTGCTHRVMPVDIAHGGRLGTGWRSARHDALRLIVKVLAGEEGLEPSHVGIKIRCLNQLGDSPTQVSKLVCVSAFQSRNLVICSLAQSLIF